ncbi:restriction endonuclease subunit S [Paraburkholderia sp. RL17-381-BIF-C]|uniref:restriction endonuclease subunit S n=1 Tax=Paraburkholderia sp. RL17-381-BIF-C TaxID=3031635 RepID=UPI0038BA6084
MKKQSGKFTPQVRFRGFSNEWSADILGNRVEFFSGLTYSPGNVQKGRGTLVLRSSNVKDGEIVDADNVYVSPDVVNCKNVEIGDVIVVVRNGSRSLIGKHAQIKKEMGNTVIGAFMTGIASSSPAFINALLDTAKFDKEVAKSLGATINQITTGNFREMAFFFPECVEQDKIGAYFNKLDRQVQLYQHKHDKLLTLKQAMLQKMFPKEGATVPEIRFKGFNGSWGVNKLEEISEIIGGGTPNTSICEYWGGDIDWYSPTEIGSTVYASGSVRKITPAGFASCSAKMLPAYKTVLFTSRAGIGDMAILTKPGCTNQGFQSLVVRDDVDPYFIYSMGYKLKKYALRHASGSTFLEISGKQLQKMEVLLPTYQEQQKIGTYFRKLDELIAQHAAQIQKLKQIKSGCLGKMFV